MAWATAWLKVRKPMRSLTLKLSLAFFLVGIIGAVLVAFLVGLRTRSEFDRFLSEHVPFPVCDGRELGGDPQWVCERTLPRRS